MKRSIDKEMN